MEEIKFSHVSVLLRECIEALNIKPDGIYVDCTAGGGGHSLEIVKRLTAGGRLIAIDRDEDALRAAGARLADYADRVTFVHSNYAMLQSVLADLGIPKADGVLADLGVSSYQLDTAERGFSYMQDAPLDMRMDREQPLSARDVVNTYSEEELRRILYDYGEEKFARNIAANIVKRRSERPIETTLELAELVKGSMPKAAREGGHHPAKRTFQAIRIEVNAELSSIPPALDAAVHALNPGGRVAVITFHSLEDRLVKQQFAALSSGCTCPREFPVCVCGKKPVVRVITKKPVTAGEDELEENPRSRSAKLRVAEKIERGTEKHERTDCKNDFDGRQKCPRKGSTDRKGDPQRLQSVLPQHRCRRAPCNRGHAAKRHAGGSACGTPGKARGEEASRPRGQTLECEPHGAARTASRGDRAGKLRACQAQAGAYFFCEACVVHGLCADPDGDCVRRLAHQ